MSYIESLKVFVRVVELGSITSGGRDLRLTPAVASKRIKELEKHLGVRLFNRTTRSLSPTEVGHVFYDEAKSVLGALETAEAKVANYSAQPRGTIQITAPLGVRPPSDRAAGAAIRRCLSRHTGADAPVGSQGRHIGRRSGHRVFHRHAGGSEHEAAQDRGLRPRAVRRPALSGTTGVPARPDDLMEHNCLLLRYPRSPEYFWTLDTAQGPRKLEVAGKYDADDGDVLTDWALDGRGIVNKPRFDVAAHLARGDLVEVLPDTPPVPTIFGCLYPHKKLQDPKVRLFVDFVVKQCDGLLPAG